MMQIMAPPTVARLPHLASMIPYRDGRAGHDADEIEPSGHSQRGSGESERVPTTVAMALRASVHPLTNLAAKIRRTTARRARSSDLGNKKAEPTAKTHEATTSILEPRAFGT
jgi:hypothetical protein